MKKIIILCVLNFCTSMHTFGMLTKRTNIITKSLTSKPYSNGKSFNYKAMFEQATVENTRLKKEITILTLKLEQMISHQDATPLSHIEEPKKFVNLPDRYSNGGKYPDEE